MALHSHSSTDDPLRRQARRLQWGLLIYLLVLLMIGVGVLRLALTARRFDGFTVTPTAEPAEEVVGGPDDTTNAGVVPVSGAVP